MIVGILRNFQSYFTRVTRPYNIFVNINNDNSNNSSVGSGSGSNNNNNNNNNNKPLHFPVLPITAQKSMWNNWRNYCFRS